MAIRCSFRPFRTHSFFIRYSQESSRSSRDDSRTEDTRFSLSVARATGGGVGTELGLRSRQSTSPQGRTMTDGDRWLPDVTGILMHQAESKLFSLAPFVALTALAAGILIIVQKHKPHSGCHNLSCRIIDIGIAIRFFIAAGDRATAPRLVPAIGRPLVLADVFLGSTTNGSRGSVVPQCGGQLLIKALEDSKQMLGATKGLSHCCLKMHTDAEVKLWNAGARSAISWISWISWPCQEVNAFC